MSHATPRLRAPITSTIVTVTVTGLILTGLILSGAPAGALGPARSGPAAAGPAGSGSCRSLTAPKARVHAAATRREVTLSRLLATLQARRDPWAMNGGQIGALQAASAGITALDDHVQTTCYSDASVLRADATTLFTNYRVYWLRVPQTHGIQAADRLAEARSRLGEVATRLAGHVDANTQARTDLAAMNQALAAADAALGTVPNAASHIAQLPGLVPAADMTADVAAMEAARSDLLAARASLGTARTAGLAVLVDLGAR